MLTCRRVSRLCLAARPLSGRQPPPYLRCAGRCFDSLLPCTTTKSEFAKSTSHPHQFLFLPPASRFGHSCVRILAPMLESSLLSGSVCEARSLIDSPARIGGETARWMDEEKWHGLGKKRCGGFRERSGLTEEKRRIWGEGRGDGEEKRRMALRLLLSVSLHFSWFAFFVFFLIYGTPRGETRQDYFQRGNKSNDTIHPIF